MIFGILIVATEPEAARRMCSLLSRRWREESKGSSSVSSFLEESVVDISSCCVCQCNQRVVRGTIV